MISLMLSLRPTGSPPRRPSPPRPASPPESLLQTSPPPATKTGNNGAFAFVENGFTAGNGFTFVENDCFTAENDGFTAEAEGFIAATGDFDRFQTVEKDVFTSDGGHDSAASAATAAAATAAAAGAGAAATPRAAALARAKLGGALSERNSSATTTPRGTGADDPCPRWDGAHTMGRATGPETAGPERLPGEDER